MFEHRGWITVRDSAGDEDDEARLGQIVLHIRHDEDPDHGNEVRVLRLARGTVSEHKEPLLSPCIPTLDDPSTH